MQLPLYSIALLASLTHASLNVFIPLFADSDATKASPSLISLSIEMDRWTDWIGTTSRNSFFYNTLDNLKQISGEAPHIRIGGNTEDRTEFRQDAKFAEVIYPPLTPVTGYPEAKEMLVGDSYYAVTRFLPPNTHVTWGLNLGENNLTTAYLQARSIVKAFSSREVKNAGIVLDYLEIGNEPDRYKLTGSRPRNYSVAQWVSDWLRFAANVSAAAGLSATSYTKLLGASFAYSSHTTTGFSPQAAFQSGLLTGPGKLISTISQHHYSSTFCSGKAGSLQDLMTKSSIRGNLSIFTSDIEAASAQGLDYILGETNSYSCHGAPGVSDTAGAALWALDYALYATQLNITRVFFHGGIGFKYSLIQPVTLTRSILNGSNLFAPSPAHVQPQYYAAIIAAEAIGGSGGAQVDEIDIDDDQITGYAFYEGGELARAVFINLNAYTPEEDDRGSVHLNLGLTGGKRTPFVMLVKRLNIDRATDTSGVTWAGQTYETSDGRVDGTLTVEIRLVEDGIEIQDTEAVLVEFLPIFIQP